ncbi:MAG: extracellular solute-binding protein [Chloroflexi bacterium]|nr:extracellular solute-binding protein [Chloroflexota bacterium]
MNTRTDKVSRSSESTVEMPATSPVSRRRLFAAAGSGAAGLAAVVAACGPEGAPAGPGGKGAKAISGTLTYWPEGGENTASYQAWVQRIADFQKAYPEAKVEMTVTQDRDAKLVTAVAAGTPPDVSVHDRYTVASAQARGIMMDIMPYFKTAGMKGEDQQPWCWEEVFRSGKLWGLPYSTDTRMVYVNREHLKKAGIPETAPKTLDDFVKVMRQLNAGSPGNWQRIGFIPVGNWHNWRLFGWGWLFGSEWYDAKANRVTMDHPKNIAALEWEVQRTQELGGYDALDGFRKAQPKSGMMDMFKAGAVSTAINSTSQLLGVFAVKDLDWIVWAPPPGPGVNRTHTWSGGFANVLPTGLKNPEASFTLAKYLSDEEFQKVQNKTGAGRLPTLKSAAKDPHWNTVDSRVKQFVDLLPFSHIRPPIVQISIMNRELDGAEGAETVALKGQKAPRQALQEANQRVNDAIKEGRAD